MAVTQICIALCFTLLASTDAVVKGHKKTICVKCTSRNAKTTCQDLNSSGYIKTEDGKYCPDAAFENELDFEKMRLANVGSALRTADRWRKFEQKIRRIVSNSSHWHLETKKRKQPLDYATYVAVKLKPLINSVQNSEDKWAVVVKNSHHWIEFKNVCRRLKSQYAKNSQDIIRHYGKYKKILKLLESLLPVSVLHRRQYEHDILTRIYTQRTQWSQKYVLQQTLSTYNKTKDIKDTQTANAYTQSTDGHCEQSMLLLHVLGGTGGGIIIAIIFAGFKCLRSRCTQKFRTNRRKHREGTPSDEEEFNPVGEKVISSRHGLFKKDLDETLTAKDVKAIMETMKSVGVFCSKGNASGTVVRVREKFIFTAWHVLERIVYPPGNIDINGKPDHEMHPENLRNITVVFNGIHFRILTAIPFYDMNLDICILELIVNEDEMQNLPPPISLFRDFKTMKCLGADPSCVHVIGLHPITSEVVFDPGCKIISRDDKVVHKANKWIYSNKRDIERCLKDNGNHAMNVDASYEDVLNTEINLIINTYLDFGGSGGAVVAFTHDRNVALVAILLKGLPPWYWNMPPGCEFPKYLRMEVGCRIQAILGSPKWTDEAKMRIFGARDGEEKMETDLNFDETIESSMSRLYID